MGDNGGFDEVIFGHVVDDIVKSAGNAVCELLGFFTAGRGTFSFDPTHKSRILHKFGYGFSVKRTKVAFGKLVHDLKFGFGEKNIRSLTAAKKGTAIDLFSKGVLIAVHKLAKFFGAVGGKRRVAVTAKADFFLGVFRHSVADKVDSVSYHISSCKTLYKMYELIYNIQTVIKKGGFLKMKTDFPRVLSLLRKEKGISQKEAAKELGVSQALLSHYEKGIRECGLEFLIRAADFYGVSADYLLGRSADPDGMTITVEDIPEPDAAKDNTVSGAGVLPIINKKIIANSLNVLFDLLAKSGSKELTKQVSGYLMAAVYRMFRIIYSFSPKNNMNTFSVPNPGALESADAYMKSCEAKARKLESDPSVKTENISVSSETIARTYPLFASSLFSLIKNCEDNMDK